MGQVLTFVWIVVLWLTTHIAATFLIGFLFPTVAGEARSRLEARPGKCFLVGLVVFLVTLLISGTLIRGGSALQILGWMAAAPLLISGLIGGAGIADIVGERIDATRTESSPALSLLAGAAATTLASLMPVAGWFVITPVAYFCSVGAALPPLARALFRRKSRVITLNHSPEEVRAVAPLGHVQA